MIVLLLFYRIYLCVTDITVNSQVNFFSFKPSQSLMIVILLYYLMKRSSLIGMDLKYLTNISKITDLTLKNKALVDLSFVFFLFSFFCRSIQNPLKVRMYGLDTSWAHFEATKLLGMDTYSTKRRAYLYMECCFHSKMDAAMMSFNTILRVILLKVGRLALVLIEEKIKRINQIRSP